MLRKTWSRWGLVVVPSEMSLRYFASMNQTQVDTSFANRGSARSGIAQAEPNLESRRRGGCLGHHVSTVEAAALTLIAIP